MQRLHAKTIFFNCTKKKERKKDRQTDRKKEGKKERKENRHVLKENTSNQNASSNMGSL